MAILFGIVVLVAGILITVGLVAQVHLALAAGFVLIGLCAIYGLQPDWPSARSGD